MTSKRQEKLANFIARYDQIGPPEDVDFMPIQLGIAELMQRALPYAVRKGKDPGREYLEGVCVQGRGTGDEAWVSNGALAVRFPVMEDVPHGLHLPDAGMVLREHDFPDMVKALPVVAKDRYPVHAFALRALAELAIECVTTPKGVPLVKIVRSDTDANVIGQACVKTGNRLPEPVCAPIRSLARSDLAFDVATGDASLYDAALVLEAVKAQQGALFMGIPRSRFDALTIERADGVLYVIAPQNFEDRRTK